MKGSEMPKQNANKKAFEQKFAAKTERSVALTDDGDLFWGHTICVYGHIEEGFTEATIEG